MPCLVRFWSYEQCQLKSFLMLPSSYSVVDRERHIGFVVHILRSEKQEGKNIELLRRI